MPALSSATASGKTLDEGWRRSFFTTGDMQACGIDFSLDGLF
jgi:hypothetical protein